MKKVDSISPDEGKRKYVSIIAIGGGAGRIVDKMQDWAHYSFDLCAFGMNRQELAELSLPNRFLIGNEGLGSGKDRSLAESECKKIVGVLKDIQKGKIFSCFVVCLGGGTGEGCIKTFIENSVNVDVRLLVVTLPHSSEGPEKRKNALLLLKELEELVDGIYVLDYDTLPGRTITEIFAEGDRNVRNFVRMFVGPICICCHSLYGFPTIRSFMNDEKSTKYIDYVSLYGDLDYFRKLDGFIKYLPSEYHSYDDISCINAVYTLNGEHLPDYMEVDCLKSLYSNTAHNKDLYYEVGLYMDPEMYGKAVRMDFFIKRYLK